MSKSKSKSASLNDLSVRPIHIPDGPRHPDVWHKVLPQHEFSMLIVAPKGSGKTNFICNLIMKHYKSYFHKILVCSPTVNNDEKWDAVQAMPHVLRENKKLKKVMNAVTAERKLPTVVHKPGEAVKNGKREKFEGKVPKSAFFAHMDELPVRIAEQQKIIDELKEHGHTKHVADRLLVVCDDQAGLFPGGNNGNPIVNYVIKHRHSSSSCIFVTQAYKAIPKTIRTNCNALVIFGIPNVSERDVIYEEFPCDMSKEEWLAAYRYATGDPFSFMYINTMFKPGERVFKNFDEQLRVDDANEDEPPRKRRKTKK